MSTLQQDKGSTSNNSVRATVTGIDSRGQLFRDAATVVFLKGQRCIYQSKIRPSPDGELMVDIPNGKETWRANARVRSVSSVGAQPGTFNVTIELERAHSLVIEAPVEEMPEAPAGAKPADRPPSRPAAPPAAAEPAVTPSAPSVAQDTQKPDPAPAELPRPLHAPSPANLPADNPVKPAFASTSAPSPKMMVTDIVRSVLASELAQLKRELQGTVTNQVEVALRKPLQALETKIELFSRQQPAITEESVRDTAARAAEKTQKEWAETQFQKIVAESVRAALSFEMDQRRREITVMILGEIEAAVRGPISSRIEAKLEEHSRKRPPLSEETVRRIAAQVAENVQLEWASGKLQKIVAEAVRSALAGEASSAKETGATGGPPRR